MASEIEKDPQFNLAGALNGIAGTGGLPLINVNPSLPPVPPPAPAPEYRPTGAFGQLVNGQNQSPPDATQGRTEARGSSEFKSMDDPNPNADTDENASEMGKVPLYPTPRAAGPSVEVLPPTRNYQAVDGEGNAMAPSDAKRVEGEASRERGVNSNVGMNEIAAKQDELAVAGAENLKAAAADELVRRNASHAAAEKVKSRAEAAANFQVSTGKFWKNPYNVMNAIALGFMPLFTNDATSGIKLINEAVDRDIAEQMREHEKLKAGEKASKTTLGLISDQFKDDVAARDYLTGKSYEVIANQIRAATSRMQGQEQRDIGNQLAAAAETQAAQLKNMALERAYRMAHVQAKALAQYERPGQPFISPIGTQAQPGQLPTQQATANTVNTAGSMPAQGTIGAAPVGQPSAPPAQRPAPPQAGPAPATAAAKGAIVAPQQGQPQTPAASQMKAAVDKNLGVYRSRVAEDETFGDLPKSQQEWIANSFLAIQKNAETVAAKMPGSQDQRQKYSGRLTGELQEEFKRQTAYNLRDVTKNGARPLTPQLFAEATTKTVREYQEGIQEASAIAAMANSHKYKMDVGGALQRGYGEMAQAMSDLRQEAIARSRASGKSVTVDDVIGSARFWGDVTNKAGVVAKLAEAMPSKDPADLAVRKLLAGQAMVANAEIHDLAGVAVKDEELDRIKQSVGFIRNESTLNDTISRVGKKVQVIDDAAFGAAVADAAKVSGNAKNPYRVIARRIADATSKTRDVVAGRSAARVQNSIKQ
jgi:hypothetical protein